MSESSGLCQHQSQRQQYGLPEIDVEPVRDATVRAKYHYDSVNGLRGCEHCGQESFAEWCYEIKVTVGSLELRACAYSCDECYQSKVIREAPSAEHVGP